MHAHVGLLPLKIGLRGHSRPEIVRKVTYSELQGILKFSSYINLISKAVCSVALNEKRNVKGKAYRDSMLHHLG